MEILLGFLESINLVYIIICNAATYVIVQLWQKIFKKTSTWTKRGISTVIAILLGFCIHFLFGVEVEPLFYGFFLQFISWDYFFKPIIERIQNAIKGDGDGKPNKMS